MGKKSADRIEELEAHVENLETRLTAMEDAARAFAVVFAIPRIPDQPGDGEG